MTARILPAAEWGRLAGTELGAALPHLDPAEAAVVVVEDGDQVVGCWALVPMWHAEGVWIAPDRRGRAGVARRLVTQTLRVARSLGIPRLQTAAMTADVAQLLEKHLGARRLPGQAFVFDVGGG